MTQTTTILGALLVLCATVNAFEVGYVIFLPGYFSGSCGVITQDSKASVEIYQPVMASAQEVCSSFVHDEELRSFKNSRKSSNIERWFDFDTKVCSTLPSGQVEILTSNQRRNFDVDFSTLNKNRRNIDVDSTSNLKCRRRINVEKALKNVRIFRRRNFDVDSTSKVPAGYFLTTRLKE